MTATAAALKKLAEVSSLVANLEGVEKVVLDFGSSQVSVLIRYCDEDCPRYRCDFNEEIGCELEQEVLSVLKENFPGVQRAWDKTFDRRYEIVVP